MGNEFNELKKGYIAFDGKVFLPVIGYTREDGKMDGSVTVTTGTDTAEIESKFYGDAENLIIAAKCQMSHEATLRIINLFTRLYNMPDTNKEAIIEYGVVVSFLIYGYLPVIANHINFTDRLRAQIKGIINMQSE